LRNIAPEIENANTNGNTTNHMKTKLSVSNLRISDVPILNAEQPILGHKDGTRTTITTQERFVGSFVYGAISPSV
jgi:hypothetical protein